MNGYNPDWSGLLGAQARQSQALGGLGQVIGQAIGGNEDPNIALQRDKLAWQKERYGGDVEREKTQRQETYEREKAERVERYAREDAQRAEKYKRQDIATAREDKLREEATVRKERMQEEVNSAVKSGDGGKIAEVSLKYPEMADTIKSTIGFTNKQTEDNFRDTNFQILSDPENTENYLNNRIRYLKYLGADTSRPEARLKMYQDNPDKFLEVTKGITASSFPEAYKQWESATGQKPKTEEEELKIKEQEAKTEKAKISLEEKKQAKEADLNSAIAGANEMISSVDALLNHPGLDKAVGIKSMAPTIPGSDAANFEAMLESFVGNLTMENMGIMKGVLSDADIKMIKNASSGLDLKMSPKAFKNRLLAIKKKLDGKLKSKKSSKEPAAPAAPAEPAAPAAPAATEETARRVQADGNFSSLWGG